MIGSEDGMEKIRRPMSEIRRPGWRRRWKMGRVSCASATLLRLTEPRSAFPGGARRLSIFLAAKRRKSPKKSMFLRLLCLFAAKSLSLFVVQVADSSVCVFLWPEVGSSTDGRWRRFGAPGFAMRSFPSSVLRTPSPPGEKAARRRGHADSLRLGLRLPVVYINSRSVKNLC